MLDDGGVMRDVESNNVNGLQERDGILQLLQRTNARLTKLELRDAESR